MSGFIGKYLENGLGNLSYFLFRSIVGLLFMQYGAQKLFGYLGGAGGSGGSVELMSLMGLAGVIEFFGGLAVFLGLFTRFFASIASVEMLIAYFMAHFPQNFFPVLNKGDLALMFFVSFLIIAKYGAGKWALEKFFREEELF